MWRVWAPFAELQRHGEMAYWKYKDDPELLDQSFLNKLASHFDAILLPRLSWHERDGALVFLRTMRRAGMTILLEQDDDVYSPEISGHQAAVFARERDKGLEALERARLDRIWLLDQVDGITVSSRRLKLIVEQYTRTPVEVVPNAIDVPWFRSRIRGVRRAIPPLTIGWAGGARYAEDLVSVAAAWSRIARRFPEVTFVVQGHIAEVLTADIPPERCRYLAWRSLEDYPSGLINIDIGCCAVAPKLFNTAKTPIKVWEYTLAGAACVITPTLYGPYVSNGQDALVAETPDEWETALARLVEDAELRRRLQRAQRRRVAVEHSLANNWWRWPAAWSSLLERARARPRLALPAHA